MDLPVRSKPQAQQEKEDLSAPEWPDWDEAVTWFRKLRTAVKNIVYRFATAMKKAIQILEETDFKGDTHHALLEKYLEGLFFEWKMFTTSNAMTRGTLYEQDYLTRWREWITCMKIPNHDDCSGSCREMRNIRWQARGIAIEGTIICGLMEEAAMRMGEYNECDYVRDMELLPAIPTYSDVPDPLTLQSEERRELLAFEESEERYLARGGYRDPQTLDLEVFAPVWVDGQEVPDISRELGKWVDGGGCQIVGSIRSIFKLSGYDEVVQMIDDPAVKIEDEIVRIPFGTTPSGFLITRYAEQGKLPRTVVHKTWCTMPPISPRTWAAFNIPNLVRQTLSSHAIVDLYPWARTQYLPQVIRVVTIPHLNDNKEFVKTANRIFADAQLSTSSEQVFFRGLSLYALESIMTSFSPTVNHAHMIDDFGPGIYTTNDLIHAKDYAGTNGAIMVFNTNLQDLKTWKPDEKGWRDLVSHYALRSQDIPFPWKYKEVDVIEGPVLATRRPDETIKPHEHIYQRAFTTSRGWERLAASLEAIIYIQDKSVSIEL